jgi:hypothetical protein
MAGLESALVAPRTDSSAIFGLEPDVHDLDRMVEIADDLVRDYFNSELIEPQRERQGELALCMLGILRDRMGSFKKNYLAAVFPREQTAVRS